MTRSCILGLVMLVSTAAHGGGVLFVDDDAAPGGDGLGWATAHAFLQDALAFAAEPGNGMTEIRVAQGTYRPDESDAAPGGTGDRGDTFALIDGLVLRGGYAGVGRPDPDERDVDLFPTILSGDLDGDDLPGFINNGENSYHVVDGTGTGATTVIDGFVIRDGNADDNFPPNDDGAGMFNVVGNPTVNDCRFERNSCFDDGGAIYTQLSPIHSTQTISGCTFEGNHAGDLGGAVVFFQKSALLDDCVFTSNTSDKGAGIWAGVEDITVTGCAFDDNIAVEAGGGIDVAAGRYFITSCTFDSNDAPQGGGMNVDLTAGISDATLTGCVFTSNSGRALYLGLTSPVITNCIFETNPDGAIRIDSSALGPPMVIGCSFAGNTTDFQGGAILSDPGELCVIGGVFESNVADGFPGHGGAIAHQSNDDVTIVNASFFDNTSADNNGGAVYLSNANEQTVVNCTFLGNSAWRGGGVSVFLPDVDDLLLANCVFSGNTALTNGGGLYTNTRNNADVVIANCTWSNNSADLSGGGSAHFIEGFEDFEMGNGIWWENDDGGGTNQAAQIRFLAETRPVHFSCVQGLDGSLEGDGNVGANPMFVDADGPDDVAGTFDDDLRLLPQSPCIDAADNARVPPDTVDIDNDGDTAEPLPADRDSNGRFRDDVGVADTGSPDPAFPLLPIVDMGAYERQESSPPVNDACSGAQLIASDTPVAFVNFGADTDGFDESGSCSVGGSIMRDVWYRFFALCDGTLVISLSDVDYDAVVAVYASLGCPDGPDQAIACLEWPDESIAFPTALGTAYRFRVGGIDGDEGGGTLTVRCSAAGSCAEDCGAPPDGAADIVDLLAMLSQWGGPGSCDIDGADGGVTINDLLLLLAAWGPCP